MAKLNWHKNDWPCQEGNNNCQELIVEEGPGWRKPLYHKHVLSHGTVILGSYHRDLVGVFKTEEEADEAVLDTIRHKIAGLQSVINED